MRSFLRKIRFFFRLLKAFWRRQKRAIIISLIVSLFLLLLISTLIASLRKKQTQRIGLVGKYTVSDMPQEIQQLISIGLTSLAEDGTTLPGLAVSWEMNKEGKEYLFTLKEGEFWQDGEPIASEDINYNFSDVAISRPNERQIRFTLKEPFSPFPVIVSRPVFKKGLVGAGKYRVKTIRKNGTILESLVLIPYQNKTEPTLVFRFYPTEKAAKTAFKLGEIDILKEIVNPEELATWPRIKVLKETKKNRFVALFFNTQDPLFEEKSARQALAYGIKDHWETKALNSINPKSWAYNSQVKPYSLDLENAKTLLKKAGENGAQLEKITLSTIPSLLETAELIRTDWEGLGVETKITILNNIEEGFQILLVSQEIPSDPDQYVLWHSTQPTNICHYKSPKIDKLLEDGRKTSNLEERKKIYQDFQRFLVEDAPVIFLFHPTAYTISRG